MKLRSTFVAPVFFGLALMGCQTTGEQSFATADEGQVSASASASAEVEADAAAEGESEKQSLDAMLDEHEKVTLVDDETGEEKLICRRIESRTGSRLGSRKLCATREQWREREKLAKEQVDGVQRNMDARCTGSAC